MQDEQPLKPANILNIVATNQGHLPLTMESPKVNGLSPDQIEKMISEGHVVVDARSSAAFGAGHIPGAFNVQLSSLEFEQRVGWVTPDDAPIILVTDNDTDAHFAAFQMAFIAMDTRVKGFLSGGMTEWMAAGKALNTVGQIDVHSMKHRLNVNGLQVLDVRETDEWDEGHIENAHHMVYTYMTNQLTMPAQLGNLNIPKDASIAVTCATGKRSSTAISMMLRDGYKNLYNVTGGMTAWEDAGFNMIDIEGCTICKV